VEHPVTEETSGIDLVLQQFRIANGDELSISEDPTPRGHSFEFRINGEDAGRGFLPAPGPVTRFVAPEGPGVRVDSGVESGSVIGGQFDSMLAKLIVTGATREEALARSRRALAEFTVEGLATVIPFHRAVVSDPAFIGTEDGFDVHTRWIETEWNNTVEPFTAGAPIEEGDDAPGQEVFAGDLIAVLEAMKMENPVNAHKDGVVTGLSVEPGAAITQGTVLAELK
ncbi:biotin/lipoyl-containing protein, partial [Rhodococcoides kroppenstedtii]|uniref:biotin/lipoyl-containing protein n=1 Tax=Rhodococcoides kroppenstedtii TaxID=293050 RepID=UPI000AF3BE56